MEDSAQSQLTNSDKTEEPEAKDPIDSKQHLNSEEVKQEEAPPEELERISAHPDFLCVAQFIGTFGGLLGITNFYIDTIEDGLNANKTDNDLYLDACRTAVEELLISLLRRCGVLTNIPKLTQTLQEYFKDRDPALHSLLSNSQYNDLSKITKLQILKFVCLSQFDENSRFKSDFNSQWAPDDLRLFPLGKDFDSFQYWFISDPEKSHRLYRWQYPYTTDKWSLLSTTYAELQRVADRLRPPEPEQQLRQGKLWELVNDSVVEPEDKPAKKQKRRKKKDMVQIMEERGNEEDEDVQFRVRKSDIRCQRKSLRNVDRKVYTEPNEENEMSEEEEHKELDEKVKKAIDIANSRKRSRKFLSISQSNSCKGISQSNSCKVEHSSIINTKLSSQPKPHPNKNCATEQLPYCKLKQLEKEALADSFVNLNKPKQTTTLYNTNKTPIKVESKDPFAFTDQDSSSRHSEDSSVSLVSHESKPNVHRNGQLDGGVAKSEHTTTQCVRKPVQQNCNVSKTFLDSLQELPSLSAFKKPEEAEDKCWKCNGEEDVDKMLFCDGCDLATYHMACLEPPIETVPEDDWFCPVCEQVLLYLNLRLKLDKLRIFTYVPHPNRSRPRRSISTPRSNAATSRPLHQTSRPRPSNAEPRHFVSRTIPYSPALITPSRPPQRYNYVTTRPRAKIGQIDRLAETARKVFDSFDEDEHVSPLEQENVRMYKSSAYGKSRYAATTYHDDSESDCEVVYPDDVDSEGSSETEFAYRPVGTTGTDRPLYGQTPPGIRAVNSRSREKKYTADDFLAEPTKTTDSKQKLGYNPLGPARSHIRLTSVRGTDDVRQHIRQPGIKSVNPVSNTNSPANTMSYKPEGTGSLIRSIQHSYSNSLHGPRTRDYTAPTRDHSPRNQIDTATAIAQGRDLDDRQIDDSRSGNVVTQTSDLSLAQRKALAAWEDMERNRKKDAFDFDE